MAMAALRSPGADVVGHEQQRAPSHVLCDDGDMKHTERI
jgi:hypothetical protein